MSNLVLSLLLDFGLAVLLIVTISYCSKLSSRIRMLQDSRGELASMISQFDTATKSAMTSLAELQNVSKRITEALQLKIDKANFLADDLAFLIEKSSKLATQLEQAKAQRVEPAPKPKPVFDLKPQWEPRPSPELVKHKPAPTQAQVLQADGTMQARSVSSLEAVLQRLSSGVVTHADAPPSSASSMGGPRTSAERELLEALKSGRG